MATTLYLRNAIDATTDWSNCAYYTRLDVTTGNWQMAALSTSRGDAAYSSITATVAGPMAGIEVLTPPGPYLFISAPLAAAATIAGSITFNLRAAENNKSANVAINCRVMRIKGVDGTVAEILKTARTTEVSITTEAANNWAATPTSTAFVRGDRIALIPFGDDAGTMGASYNFTLWWEGPTAGASGDSYATFTETLTFESTPTGTTVYPTATSAGIDPGAATELEAWTSRGGGVATAVTNTPAGDSSGAQTTATAGGTAVEWYTKPLVACTLSGPVLVNVRGLESNALANVKHRCEIALCATDGTGATVWGTSGGRLELTISETARQFWVSGGDLSITNGQRLRVRLFIDDAYGAVGGASLSGYTATTHYAGAAGATGDTYLTFPITLTEYSAGVPYSQAVVIT